MGLQGVGEQISWKTRTPASRSFFFFLVSQEKKSGGMQRTPGFPGNFVLSWSTRHVYIVLEISRKSYFTGFPDLFLVYQEKTPEAQPEISPGFPGTSTVSWNSSNIGVYLDFKVIFSSWFTKKNIFSWFTGTFRCFPGLPRRKVSFLVF